MLSTGTFLIHLHYLKSYKKEFKIFLKQTKNIRSKSTIYVNPNELYANSEKISWEDDNKEISYQGILYDIIRIENRGLKVAIIAVSDEQEMFLKKQFAELFDLNANETTKNPLCQLKSFFNLKCIVAHLNFDTLLHFYNHNSSTFPHSFLISPIFLETETPPPDLLS